MVYKIKRPVKPYYIPLSDKLERRLDAEWRVENRGIGLGAKVKLRDDVLLRHARSVPAHAGYTKEQFAWRDTLNNLEGKTGVVSRTFPDSSHVNVDFNGHLIGIDKSELIVVGGKGWRERPDMSGKAPRHRVAANRSKTKNLLRKQIGVNLKGFPRLREVVRNYLDKQWDEASNSPESTMLSMGWEPFDIDDSKFSDYMDGSFIKTINGVVKSMVRKAMEMDRGLGDDEITELLVWYLTGDLDRNSLRDYSDLSERLGAILSDTSSNWIAEGFNKSRLSGRG